ncbi:glycosyltransferase family 4 protein [Leadbettera azotonutricia]|uniref:Glycosyltransferase, group 4 family n=1 Tax=Leadbettera azotonutricia (strain ATCC BAA-888 / DSM 13862 / ZAS-9) TaxID=545695 RepID=F5YAJ3_LEAAZ|nr:MraY family glycosyltransferase [Leadbettera azotonutricia]AEF80853.1 glycosyltransferase, group 4 family [Leadbettera azotonutricia ZAS-9]
MVSNDMRDSIILTILSFVFSLIAVALMLRVSTKKAWYDEQNERKIHAGDIPRLGGAGFATVFIAIALFITLRDPESSFRIRFFFPILALVLVLVSGIMDDFKPLRPLVKLLIQVVAALCIVIPGYTFKRFFFTAELAPGFEWVLNILSFIWIVGLTNAMNFIDGVDGLAGGVSFLAVLAYAAIFMSLSESSPVALYCFCLMAVLLGFLVFNLPLPAAKIFMGDGGSQFLGFILALFPLLNWERTAPAHTLPLFYAAALLLLPILDTVAAIWRRVRDGRAIYLPDKSHTHHKLMNLGLKARGVDGFFYGMQIILGLLVLFSVRSKGAASLILLGAAYVSAICFFVVIHFVNRKTVVKQPLNKG